ncbi:MAG: hypothetical protein LBK93_00100 [Rickettsiales bacterium]|jgi:hypothetical protein|nr:hypothetical protein [Rickettsiales bacterium]
MNRFFKAVLCAVMLASLIGCGGDDNDNSGGGEITYGCEYYGNCSGITPEKIFIGLPSAFAVENFENETYKLQLSTSILNTGFLDLGFTGSYGAKYVVKKLTSEDQAYSFLSNLIQNKGFNKNYLDQFLSLTVIGTKLNDLLNNLGLNTELRHYSVGFNLGTLGGYFLDSDLYIDRASAKIDAVGDGEYIVTLTTYVTGWFSEFDNASLNAIYGELDAPVAATLTERIYSPFVFTNDSILKNYASSLVSNQFGFSYVDKREVVKHKNGVTYSLSYDHGADLVTWSVEKDISYREVLEGGAQPE